MGLFDFLGKKKPDAAGEAPKRASVKDMSRLGKLAGDKMAQNYDRQEAIEELSKMRTGEAAAALLRRFSFTMEPSITDQEEKEAAAEGIVAAGEAAIDPIRKYCARAESLTWALKVLRRIVGDDQMAKELLELLAEFDTEYLRNPEPKIQLLSVLEEHPSDDVRVGVEPFVTDVNETVRFHAVVTTFAMNDERSVVALVEALEQEESLRVKNRIASGIADKGWKVPGDIAAKLKAALPPGFTFDGERVRA
jgi:HEAT repeat protein